MGMDDITQEQFSFLKGVETEEEEFSFPAGALVHPLHGSEGILENELLASPLFDSQGNAVRIYGLKGFRSKSTASLSKDDHRWQIKENMEFGAHADEARKVK